MEKRDEHLQWCKDRAMKYVNDDDLKNAFASFQSDMIKHSETRNHLVLQMVQRHMIKHLIVRYEV